MNDAMAKIQARERNREKWFRQEIKNNQYLNNLNTLYKNKVNVDYKTQPEGQTTFYNSNENNKKLRDEKIQKNKKDTLEQIQMNNLTKQQMKEIENQMNRNVIQNQLDSFKRMDLQRQEFLTKINSLNNNIL